MLFTTKTLATLLATTATTAYAFNYTLSKPFNLILVSENATLSGQYLSPCHWHVLTEGLCPTTQIEEPNVAIRASFNHNYTAPYENLPNVTEGSLTWVLGAGESTQVPMTLQIRNTLFTNVALPMLNGFADYGVFVSFDENGLLYMSGTADDRVVPIDDSVVKRYYRWFVCNTLYNSYRYQTLVWVLGEAKPENPTCIKVEVRRKWLGIK